MFRSGQHQLMVWGRAACNTFDDARKKTLLRAEYLEHVCLPAEESRYGRGLWVKGGWGQWICKNGRDSELRLRVRVVHAMHEAMVDALAKALSHGEEVEIPGFGVLYRQELQARTMYIPLWSGGGAFKDLKRRKVIRFKAFGSNTAA